jgi:hypothetical protein
MDSRGSQKDEHDELRTASASSDEAAVTLTLEEERGIGEAMTSLDAGKGLSFEDVFRELEDFEDS